MISNYLKITLRYLKTRKLYSGINIIGLALSFCCSMLVILYTKDEFSFDRFHQDIDQIHLVTTDIVLPDGSTDAVLPLSSIFEGPRFHAEVPGVVSFTRIAKEFRNVKLEGDVQSQLVHFADPNFFTMFTFPLLRGDASVALQMPGNVVLSQDVAERYFGTIDAIGKSITIEYEGKLQAYFVSGVAMRCPENSTIQFEVVMPLVIPVEEEQTAESWINLSKTTFIKLAPGTDVGSVEQRMQKVFETESSQAIERVRKFGFNEKFVHRLIPFSNVYMEQRLEHDEVVANGSSAVYSYLLISIAVFIILIACVNFINLAIAQSIKRAKEIGIRKVMGSVRKQLIFQFVGESFLICVISFGFALLMANLLLPQFNFVVGKSLSLSYLLDGNLILTYSGLLVVTCLLAGSYPAFVLSGYSPVQTLYKRFRISGKNYFQKTLIVFQFTLTTVVIIGAVAIYLQFDYLIDKELGYNPSNLLRVSKSNLSEEEVRNFSNHLAGNVDILGIAPYGHFTMNVKINGDSIRNVVYEAVNENFLGLMEVPVIAGRNFEPSAFDTAHAVIVNSAFVRMAGWKEPIGQQVELFPFEGQRRTIVGVVKDYHFEPLRVAIKPQAFTPKPDFEDGSYEYLIIRLRPGSEGTALNAIEHTFKGMFPLSPYVFEFSEDINRKNYISELKWRKVIFSSAVLTIIIAGIGLFALSTMISENRFKEVGIRKVLGASVGSIIRTVSSEIIMLIALSILLAIPIAYTAIAKWLESYPYRVILGLEVFVVAALIAVTVGTLTVSYQIIKVALTNPVESIRRND